MMDEKTKAVLNRPSCSVDEVAEMLGLSRPTIIAAIDRKELAATKIGTRYIIPTAPLRKLLQIDDGMLSTRASAA